MGDNTTTLFFSKFCPNCKQLLYTLKTNKLLNVVTNYYCIDNRDNTGIRQDIPSFLKVVPAVITPESQNSLLEGKDAFIWVDFLLRKSDNVMGCETDDGFCSWDSDINKSGKSITEIIEEDDPSAINSMYGATITGIEGNADPRKSLPTNDDGKDNSKRLEEIQKLRQHEDKIYKGNNPM